MNDAELLAMVGYPVLMANASQSLQQLLPQAARAPHHDQRWCGTVFSGPWRVRCMTAITPM